MIAIAIVFGKKSLAKLVSNPRLVLLIWNVSRNKVMEIRYHGATVGRIAHTKALPCH
jgi:hypothetical protein